MDYTFEMTQKHVLTEQNISDLMVTALEGGINYWCGEAGVKRDDDDNIVGIPENMQEQAEDMFISDLLPVGATLILTDLEVDDGPWELTMDKFIEGVKRTMIEENFHSIEELMDNHDAITADTIVQFALFNEIVYG